MKKSLIYTSLCGLALLASSLTTVAINSVNAETSNDSSAAIALESSLATSNKIASKNETVYVMTDASGAAGSVFINNNLDSDASALPLELKITYTLDGSEVSAADLAGKSGHVKINYSFASTKTSGSTKVPFLTVTGTILDGDKFKNVKINNGKVISENNDNITLAGYAVVGLNENLGTDILPSDFTIEADVADFEMGETYTLATNELFAEFDTSKLNSLDDLISSMNELSSGLDQLIAGAGSLSNGLDSALSGVTALQSGAASLNTGANSLASGAAELSSGLNELTAHNDTLNSGASQILSSLLSTTANTINSNNTLTALINGYGISFGLSSPISLSANDYNTKLTTLVTFLTYIKNLPTTDATTAAILSASIDSLNSTLSSLDDVAEFVSGLEDYTAGVSSAASGAAAILSGANQLLAGTVELKTGVDQLASGTEQLADGSKTLKSGLETFKASGIDKLVNFANGDLENFLTNLRSSVSAAKSYHSYKSSSAESVKFIFKTPSIKQ